MAAATVPFARVLVPLTTLTVLFSVLVLLALRVALSGVAAVDVPLTMAPLVPFTPAVLDRVLLLTTPVLETAVALLETAVDAAAIPLELAAELATAETDAEAELEKLAVEAAADEATAVPLLLAGTAELLAALELAAALLYKPLEPANAEDDAAADEVAATAELLLAVELRVDVAVPGANC